MSRLSSTRPLHIFFLLQTPQSMSDERSLALSSRRSVLGLLSSCSLVSLRMCFQGSPQCTLVLAPLCATHHLLLLKLPSCIVSSDMCLYCNSKSHVSVLSNFVILPCGSSDKNLVKCTTKSVYRFKAVHIKTWMSNSLLLFLVRNLHWYSQAELAPLTPTSPQEPHSNLPIDIPLSWTIWTDTVPHLCVPTTQ